MADRDWEPGYKQALNFVGGIFSKIFNSERGPGVVVDWGDVADTEFVQGALDIFKNLSIEGQEDLIEEDPSGFWYRLNEGIIKWGNREDRIMADLGWWGMRNQESDELTPAEAERESDVWAESGIAPEDIPRDDQGNVIPIPERGEVRTALERIPDPKGSGRSLVPDTYINAQIKPEEWAVFVPVEWGAPEGLTDPGEIGARDFAGQLGVRDEEIFQVRPESPILQSVMGEDFMSLRWEDDPTELGMAFTPAMLEDVPFTMQDAYGVYLAQTPENQRLISEGLALGTGNTSYMYSALGDRMFTDPDAIYEDENVRLALVQMAKFAGALAGVTEGGFQTLGDEFVPEVYDPQAVQDYSDQMFELAKNAGAVIQIGSAYGNSIASKVMASLTGKSGDDPRFRSLVAGWTENIQRETMGRRNVSQGEIQAMYGEEIKKEYAQDVATNEDLVDAGMLAEIMGIRV